MKKTVDGYRNQYANFLKNGSFGEIEALQRVETMLRDMGFTTEDLLEIREGARVQNQNQEVLATTTDTTTKL